MSRGSRFRRSSPEAKAGTSASNAYLVCFIPVAIPFGPHAQPPKSQICHVVKDSNWEIALAQALEGHDRVLAYAKNQALGFEIPYLDGGTKRRYLPDFVVRLDTAAEPLHLLLEMKGQRDESDKAKAQTARELWVPGVNALGGYGRWAFAEFTDPYATDDEFRALATKLIDGVER